MDSSDLYIVNITKINIHFKQIPVNILNPEKLYRIYFNFVCLNHLNLRYYVGGSIGALAELYCMHYLMSEKISQTKGLKLDITRVIMETFLTIQSR